MNLADAAVRSFINLTYQRLFEFVTGQLLYLSMPLSADYRFRSEFCERLLLSFVHKIHLNELIMFSQCFPIFRMSLTCDDIQVVLMK